MLGDSLARTLRARLAVRAACVWVGMAIVGALTLETARLDALALVTALGTLAVMSRHPGAIAAPLVGAALIDVTILPLAVAATAISWDAVPGFAPPRLDSEPQRQLMRSRRRNEAASVVIVQADRPPGPARLWPSLRA